VSQQQASTDDWPRRWRESHSSPLQRQDQPRRRLLPVGDRSVAQPCRIKRRCLGAGTSTGWFRAHRRRSPMVDKDRIEGAAEQAKGSIKKGIGSLTGDEKLKAEGSADKAKGQAQNAVGGAKDKIREVTGKE
jgi:uncharacterized protein YjbJ (UPF0337 family)